MPPFVKIAKYLLRKYNHSHCGNHRTSEQQIGDETWVYYFELQRCVNHFLLAVVMQNK